MENDRLKAKEIFFRYNGDKYGMELDGILDEYASFRIPAQIEKNWLGQIFEKEFSGDMSPREIKKKYLRLGGLAERICDISLLDKLLAFLDSKAVQNELPLESRLYLYGNFIDTLKYYGLYYKDLTVYKSAVAELLFRAKNAAESATEKEKAQIVLNRLNKL